MCIRDSRRAVRARASRRWARGRWGRGRAPCRATVKCCQVSVRCRFCESFADSVASSAEPVRASFRVFWSFGRPEGPQAFAPAVIRPSEARSHFRRHGRDGDRGVAPRRGWRSSPVQVPGMRGGAGFDRRARGCSPLDAGPPRGRARLPGRDFRRDGRVVHGPPRGSPRGARRARRRDASP